MTETAGRPEPLEEWGTDAVPVISESEDEETIVPVRIVESGRSRELRKHRGFRMVVPGGANMRVVQVIGGNEDRRRLFLYNTSPDPAFSIVILDDEAQSHNLGYALVGSAGLEIYSEGAVWAVNQSGLDITLSAHEEYSVPEL
jgi:hypothetical protein